mgnify:CR=1 FL=1
MLDREFFSDFMHRVFIGTSGGGPKGYDQVKLTIGNLRNGLASAVFEAYVYMHPAVYGEDASKAIAFAEEIEKIVIDAQERSIETCKAYALRDGIDTSDVNFLQQRDYSPTVISGRNGISARLKDFPGEDGQGMNAKEAAAIRKEREQRRNA